MSDASGFVLAPFTGDAFAFWLASLAIAAVALPISFRLFARFPDGGAGLAFPLGLVLSAYLYFILRVVRVLPEGRGGFVAAVAALALVAAWFAGDRRFRATLWRSANGIVVALVTFTVLFFVATALRSYTPDIAGTEQPMDFLYLNAAIHSPEYPPQDPWLAGERASYYYFGYVQAAVLTEVAGVPASTGYNLALAFTFAASGTAIASLVTALVRWAGPRRWRLRRSITAVSAAVWILLFCGSLIAVFEWFSAHGHANETIYGIFDAKFRISCAVDDREWCYNGPAGVRTASWYPDRWWFESFFPLTRMIPGTIVESPVFSFQLGDLHPHVTAIPLVLLAISVAAAAFRGQGLLSWRTHRAQPTTSVVVALIVGALAFQNAWDVLTFSFVLAMAVLTRNLRSASFVPALRAAGAYLGPIAAVALVAFLPWYVDFSSQAAGLYPYVGAGTSPAHVFLQWGPPIAAGLLSLAWLRRGDLGLLSGNLAYTFWVPLVPLGLWASLAAYHSGLGNAIADRGGAGWVTLLVLGAIVALLASAFSVFAARRSAAALPAGLAATGILLLYGAELLYIRDVFGGVPRMNTVFKLSYQAWILLAASGAVSLATALVPARPLARKPSVEPEAPSTQHSALATTTVTAGTGVALALVALAGVFAITGWPNRTGGFENERSIDGLAGLSRNNPAEYALVRWVEANVPPGATIVEATGRAWRPNAEGQPVITEDSTDYTDSGRVAARTGRPSPIGWFFHEVQWRGDTSKVRVELNHRQDLVDRVYTAGDAAAALAALRELDAEYVVLGQVERAEYDQSLWPPFDSFMDLVFESGDVRVYRLPVYKAIPTS